MGKRLRVLVLGLDGLHLDMFKNKLSSYKGFKQISKNNALIARNRAFKPVLPVTYPSWASIETGLRPAQHGLPDFFTPEGELLNALHLEAPRVYEVASLAGLRVLVINPVPSYPLPVPSKLEVVAYDIFSPKPQARGETARHILRLLPTEDYIIEGCDASIAARAVEAYTKVLLDTISSRHFDLVWITISYPDHLLHKCIRAHFEIVKGEREIIENIGRLVHEGLDTLFDVIIIVSDHGFKLYRRVINVNVALAQAGLARFTTNPQRAPPLYMNISPKQLPKVIQVNPRLVKILHLLRVDGIARRVKNLVENLTGVKIRQSLYPDWYASKALMASSLFGVILRDKGVLESVLKLLSDLEGVKLVEPREKFDIGPYTERYPHIIILPDFDSGYMLSRSYSESIVEEKTMSYHHPDGVLIIYPVDSLLDAGFDVDTSVKVVTPPIVGTLMYALLGLPVQKGAAKTAAERLLGVKLAEADHRGKWLLARRAMISLSGKGTSAR